MKCGSPADWHVRSDSGSGHVSQPHEAGSVTISGALPSCGFAASSARNFLRAICGGAGPKPDLHTRPAAPQTSAQLCLSVDAHMHIVSAGGGDGDGDGGGDGGADGGANGGV